MKKALVMTFVLVLGLGLGAFAAGALSGTWSVTISFDPTATVFTDLVGFSSDLEIDYTIGGWTFTSTSGFSNDGYDAQSFTAGGIVGAFTFSSTMNFLPMAIAETTKTLLYDGSVYNCVFPFPSTTLGLPADLTLSAAALANELLDPVPAAAVPEFDDWTVEGSVSIAGLSFEALFFMEDWAGTLETTVTPTYWYEVQTTSGVVIPATALVWSGNPASAVWDYYMPQSGSYTVTNAADLLLTGAGWRFKAAGSFGDVALTSYTYFNLVEGFAMDADPDTKSFARDGEFLIPLPGDQVVRFTEEYITLEGMSLGCVVLDAALRVTCDDGFDYFALWFKDIYLMCCGITVDFEIDFGVASKTVELFPTITTDWTCIEPTIEFDLSDDKSIINGFKLTALAAEIALNGITFESNTIFDASAFGTVDSGTTEDTYVLVPAVTPAGIAAVAGIPSVADNGDGYYMVHKISFADDYYETFEDFTITVDGDTCCGGAFDISLQTWFGTHYTDTLAEFGYWYETNVAVVGGAAGALMDHGQGLFWDVAGTYGAAGTWYIYDDDALGPPAVAGQQQWYPGIGFVPVAVVDVAYSTLIGLDGIPTDYSAGGTVVPVATQTLTPAHNTTKTAVGGGLFGWAKSTVATTIGVGSNFALSFGFTIDAYGWNGIDFGFEFTF